MRTEKATTGKDIRFHIKKPEYIALVFGIVAVVFLPMLFTSRYITNMFILATALAIATLGLTVSLGYTGQLSLAQAVFYSIGAYAIGLGTTRWNVNWWVALAIGLVFAAITGLILGLTTLKVGGRYLAMVTICVQIVFALVLINWTAVTGGPDGISGIKRPSFIVPLDTSQKFSWFALSMLFIIVIFVWKLKTSRLGRSMRAVRENELAAEALGVDSLQTKTIAFVICGVLGALGGAIFASGFLYISPDGFTYTNSVEFLAMVLVGGSESAMGTVLGAMLLTFLPEMLRDLKEIYLVIYGSIIIFVIIFMPEGLWGYVDLVMRHFTKPKAIPPARKPLKIEEAQQDEVLVVEGLAKYFGGLKALDGIDFVVRKGEIHTLIGPNGSGKTTCINLISGIYTPTYGKIKFLGTDITGMRSNRISRLGLTRTFQNLRLFRELSVWENVLVGSQHRSGSEEDIRERAISAIEFVGLSERVHEKCKNLPYGIQKLVELARSLAGEPKFLLLDEPAAGLNESEKEQLADLLKRIHEMGLTILLVEHDMSLVAQLATKATVLNFGQKISAGDPDIVLKDPVVIEAYLGNMEVNLDA
jgi:branched-chain amino acid transport system permease protein